MDEDLMLSHLTPSDEMVHKLQLKQQAATAVSQADIDARLRRALLRQHQAQQHTYHTGQQVFYWRDAAWCRTKNPMEGPSNHCHG